MISVSKLWFDLISARQKKQEQTVMKTIVIMATLLYIATISQAKVTGDDHPCPCRCPKCPGCNCICQGKTTVIRPPYCFCPRCTNPAGCECVLCPLVLCECPLCPAK